MPALNAILTGLTTLTLPPEFSYRIPSPRKRHSVVQTQGAIRVHVAPAVVPGDSLIAWNLPAVERSVWDDIRTFFVDEGGNEINFTGYWGDEFTIKFLIFDDVPVRSLNFNLSGSFQILEDLSFGTAGP